MVSSNAVPNAALSPVDSTVPMDVATPGTVVPVLNSSARIPALDGLRGIAILLVLMVHSFLNPDFQFAHHPLLSWFIRMNRFDWSGVDLFFVLSGFLIGGILLDARDSKNYFKTFYLRRAYRILPLYFLILTVGWLTFQAGQVGWLRGPWAELFSGRIPWWAFFTFTQNIMMARTGDRLAGRSGLSPTWSLAVEEQFYLTLPLVVRYASRRRLVQLVLGVIVGAPILRFSLMLYAPSWSYEPYLLTPCRADALGMGVLVALAARDQRVWSWLRENRALIYAVAAILFLVFLGMDFSLVEPFSPRLFGAEYSLLAALYASVLLIAITAEDWFVRTLFCNKLLMKLGLIAYGTYLIHRSTLQLAHLWLGASGIRFSTGLWAASMLLGLGGAIALAQISWTWFEKPLVRRGHQYKY